MKKRKFKELSKLKGLLREKNITYKKIASMIGINYTTFSDKINGYSDFTLNEANNIIQQLQIGKDEIYDYFF
jgi:predicted transcriptional regulator